LTAAIGNSYHFSVPIRTGGICRNEGMLITRRVEFSASHVCHSPVWTNGEPRALRESANPHGMGTTCASTVSLEARPIRHGMVFRSETHQGVLHAKWWGPCNAF